MWKNMKKFGKYGNFFSFLNWPSEGLLCLFIEIHFWKHVFLLVLFKPLFVSHDT